MRRVIIYLDEDPRPSMRREFLRVASRLQRMLEADELHPAHDGYQLLDIISKQPEHSVDHLIFVCHGGTTYLLRSTAGVHVWKYRPPLQVPVTHFAAALTSRLGPEPLISLCSCLCGRDPRWYLKSIGELTSPWGPRSYRPGGTKSFAGRLRDQLVDRDVRASVRAHTAVGHVTALPLLREFRPHVGAPGVPLFELVHRGQVQPTLAARRRWVQVVRGRPAERWLLGDDQVVDEIRSAW